MSNIATQAGNALLTQNEADTIRVLQNSLYPGAERGSVELVLDYCKAAGLDPMQKPVHIVPMWDSKAGKMRDVIMPGVNLYRTQAARSGKFAGMTEPEFGPEVTTTLGGQSITYPDWCRVTVKRLLDGGIIAEFTAVEYWTENYAVKGGKEKSIAPNAMWQKRPRGQIAKCAAAQALRIAFPEIASQPTAEEMEGKSMQFDQMPDIGPVKQEPTAELLEKADLAARKGVAEYQKFWTEVGKDGRASLASYHDAFKQAAVEVDASRTIDAAPDADFVAGLDAGEAQ